MYRNATEKVDQQKLISYKATYANFKFQNKRVEETFTAYSITLPQNFWFDGQI